MAFAKASNHLTAYAITPQAVFARDEILLAPSKTYSILEDSKKDLKLNLDKLKSFLNPSRYREMIIILNKKNSNILAMVTDTGRKII